MDESVQKHLEQQQTGTLTLSQAMRVGIAISPQQNIGTLYHYGASCALGAVALGRGWVPSHDFEWSADDPHGRFLSDVRYSEMWQAIALRNDRGWTREQIADWLESQGL